MHVHGHGPRAEEGDHLVAQAHTVRCAGGPPRVVSGLVQLVRRVLQWKLRPQIVHDLLAMHPAVRGQRENLHHRGGAATPEVALIEDPSVDLHAERAHQPHQHRHERTVTQPGEAAQVVAFPHGTALRFAGAAGCSAAA